ncbi:MAG: hypothetical protein H6978_02835 [Gammaproteobacteria bacterium]|nr:hypothetical protein [Gammaproteobacteria bacterium]
MHVDRQRLTTWLLRTLFAVILCSQLAGVLHVYDTDSHVDDRQCELCVHFSDIGNGIVADALFLPHKDHTTPPVANPAAPLTTAAHGLLRNRGPPLALES